MKQTRKLLAVLLVLFCLLSVVPLAGAAGSTGIRNVIFMIGDGMGYNHLKLAEEQGYEILMDDLADLAGWSHTRSASHAVTDSAAGATALSCGVRVKNRTLCVYPDDLQREASQPRIITENAMRRGMKVGIVTTDLTTGATPSGFSVHTDSRDNTEEIVAQQLASGIDLIWGRKQKKAAQADVEAAGFTYVTNVEELNALPVGSRSYGQFADGLWKTALPATDPSLALMTAKAVQLLTTDNYKGFFLMVEGAHIDKNANDSRDGMVDYPDKVDGTCQAVKTFDDAVRMAVDFARKDGHTLVIVTADHETGNLYFDEDTGRYTFHSASHTATDVPVFVYGANDLFAPDAAVDNCDLPNLIAKKLGWSETFPIVDSTLPVPETPETPETPAANPNACPYCGEVHTGLLGFFVRIFHLFLLLFR